MMTKWAQLESHGLIRVANLTPQQKHELVYAGALGQFTNVRWVSDTRRKE